MENLKDFVASSFTAPKEIHVESSSWCNGGCITCPREGMERNGDMKESLYIKIVDEIKEAGWRLDYFHLHLNGEPLHLPIGEFVYRINYAKENLPGTPIICFFTNASLMNRDVSRKLLESKIDKIVFSVDGGNKEAFEAMRKGLKWETVVGNIAAFMEIRKELGSNIPTQTAFIPCKTNERSLPEYYKLFQGLGIDDVGGSGVNNIGGLIDSKKMRLGGQYIGGHMKNPCWRVFLDLSICSDGQAVVCCQDVLAKLVVGDSNTESVKEIWQGKKFETVRQLHLAMKQENLPFCKDCDYMESFIAPDWWPKYESTSE